LQIDILRDQASLYGVSATRIQNLLANAYSQNYVYLIKKPDDQYQVILEANDQDRSKPEDLSLLYIRSDDGSRMVPLSAVATGTPSSAAGRQSHQPVHQRDDLLQSYPGVPLGIGHRFHRSRRQGRRSRRPSAVNSRATPSPSRTPCAT
jgi:hypothetical protein